MKTMSTAPSLMACCISFAGPLLCGGEVARGAAQSTLIRDENAKPGTLDWQLTRVRLDSKGFRSAAIEGYCSRQSVLAGQTLDIMVSTDPPAKFKIEIFRTGYYGGRC